MTETSMIVNGFTVVPLIVKPPAFGARRYLYLKRMDKTVFVGNIHTLPCESDFEKLFDGCGKIERVTLRHKPWKGKEEGTLLSDTDGGKKPPKIAYLEFKTVAGAKKAIELPYTPLTLETPQRSGLERYKQEYLEANKPLDEEATKKAIYERMAAYDKAEKEKLERLKNSGPDEDGWEVVTRVGKKKGARRTEAEEERVKSKEGRKRKRKELVNFYSFQNREQKKKRIEELREQFEKDRSKIELMKKERKFRPF